MADLSNSLVSEFDAITFRFDGNHNDKDDDAALLDAAPGGDAADGVVLAQNGQIVLEAESATLEGNWETINADGETAVLWDAAKSSYGKVPDGQTLKYEFETDEGGAYSIAMRSGRIKDVMNASDRYKNGKERTDTGNDAYVSIVNAETGEVVKKPTKLFTGLGGSDGDLRWGTTFDANHKKSSAQVDLDANTRYRLEVTGRSDGYFLDRITLSNDGFLRDADASPSPTQGSTLASDPNSTPGSETPPADSSMPGSETPTDASFIEQVLTLTNEFRTANGKAPLTLNADLTEAAADHASDMAQQDFFSHTGQDGSSVLDRAQETGYDPRAVGENIAAGQTTPEQVVQAWIDSPGHRANLLSDNYTELGVGYTFLENDTGNVNYNHYWAQVFGSSASGSTDAGTGGGTNSSTDAGTDATMDGGTDGSMDAGTDASTGDDMDAGTDGGMDAGTDGGMDGDMDAGSEGGTDADMDAGSEGGTDANTDSGMDGDMDAGSEGGTDADTGADMDAGSEGDTDANTD
ncbi:MAG: CAP domain-containing protein [Elainellaceae cyanobacterium]